MTNFIEKFRSAVHAHPEKAALVWQGKQTSYAELEKWSNAVATALRERGVGAGAIVPVRLPRSDSAIAAFLGVLKSGAAFTSISASLPPERVDYILRDTNASVVIDAEFMASLPDAGIVPEAFNPVWNDPAVVVYTSGSTGMPKGVVNGWRTFDLSIETGMVAREETDVSLSTTPFSFIAITADVFAPLAAGTSLHIADDTTRTDAMLLAEYCRANGVTTATMVPRILSEFLKVGDGLLRLVHSGSEKVCNIYSETTTIWNVYGASETCGPICTFHIDKRYDATPIGTTGPESHAYIMDDGLNELPNGELGELCVSGQVALGYLNLPELTARQFVPNPRSTGKEDKVLYRTGDLCRKREDGVIEYIQRKDWMLKIRGNRVEPGEIEAAIVNRTVATVAAVVGFDNAVGQTSLYATYVADQPLAPEEVVKALRGFLPDYMLPTFLEQVEALPVNLNGKVDRTRIKPPDAARFLREYASPRNDVEKALCDAFAVVLGLERVGLEDDFLALGGDSIAAVRLQTTLADFSLAPADILRLRTPGMLAPIMKKRERLAKAQDREEWPLTFSERQMATEQGMDRLSVAYNVGVAFDLKGLLDADKLERAFNSLVARHRILRSSYPLRDGEFRHRLLPELKVTLLRERCAAEEVEDRIREVNTPFDLACPPLVRLFLFETGDNTAVLFLNAHHIIIDGVSGGLLMDELWKLYRDESLPPVERDYLDWAAWQEANPPTEESERFFLDMFTDGVPENEMPTRPLRPEVLPYADSIEYGKIDAGKVRRAALRSGVTEYSLLTAAVGMTLAKYCGSEDVVLGVAVNGRALPETGAMQGMFVNTLPLRVKPDGDMTVGEYVRQTADMVTLVKDHQLVPFERLVRQLAPERTAARGPLFDLQFNYLNQLPTQNMDGLTVERRAIRGQALAADMHLEMSNDGGTLWLSLSYSERLYEAEIVVNMLEQLVVCIERLCDEGENRTIGEVSDLPKKQRQRILVDFAGKCNNDNLGSTVIDLFRDQARKTPDLPAVRSGARVLSYGQLDRLTDNLAAELQARGFARGAKIGILVDRNENFVLGALGALKSDAAYLPLDPSYPAERLEFMLEDAATAIIIGEESLRDAIPGYSGDWLFTRDIAGLPDLKPAGEPESGDLFVLIYTSGTTGKPKGVMINHANVTDLCAWNCRYFSLTDKDGVAAYASFGFDASVVEIFPALISGAQLHVISADMRLDMPGLNEYFNQNGVTVATLTTQLGRQFAEAMDNHSLRALSVAGEALVPLRPPETFNFYNQYGPTEFTVGASTFAVDRLYDRIPIGKPNDNTRAYIVDPRGRLAPVGVGGELLLSGRGVAQGYLNRPDLTAEKFIINPFSSDPGYERAYRTGDVVRFLPSGDLDFLGRRDFQVKIRGFRVELTEIESRVRAFPAVRDATVVAQDAPGGGKCAVAYVVSETPINSDELDRFIADELPPYMVPAAIVQVDAIPLNPNGKVDRRKLPTPSFGAAAKEDSARSLTDLEKGILAAVKEVLGHDAVAVDSNLMQSGLASLSAIKLSTLLTKRYGVPLPVKELLASPSVLSIENTIVQALLNRTAASSTPAIPKRRLTDRAEYPLTPAQEQMYILRNTLEDKTAYNIPSTYLITGEVDEARLVDALEELVHRHASLRSYFVSADDGIRLRIAGDVKFDVLRAEADATDAGSVIDSWIMPFDLERPPLFRFGLLRLRDGDLILFMDVHHSIADGVSIAVLLGDLTRLYAGENLPALELDFVDYSLWRSETLDKDALDAQRQFWLRQLENELPYSEIIPDFDRPPVMDQRGGAVSVCISKKQVQALRVLAGKYDTSLFTILAAGWGLLLSRYTGVEAVVFGIPFSGRNAPGLDEIVGMFVSTQAVRLQPGLGTTVDSYLRETAKLLREAQAHQDASIAEIIEELGIQRDASRNPLYSTVFNFFTLADAPGGMDMRQCDYARRIAHFDLDIEAREERDNLCLEAVFATRLYSKQTMTTLLDRFRCILEALPGATDRKLGEIEMVTPAERELICQGGSDSSFSTIPWEKDCGLDLLLRQRAAAIPDKIALVCGDTRMTYREVDEASDHIAAVLSECGVGRESVVGLLCLRSERFTLAALGVMKAGGAYMPMDQNSPPERIKFMLEDAKAAAVIVDDALRDLLPDSGVTIYSTEDLTRPGERRQGPERLARPEDAFIVLYTSGSTGNPKGAVLEHRAIVSFCRMHIQRASITENDISAAYASFAFDASMMDVYPFLVAGGTVHIIPEEMRLNLPALNSYFEDNGITCAFMTTQLGKQFIENYQPPSLREFSLGGEKLGVWTRGDRVFNNIYGPTECTVYTNCHPVDHPELRAPIGFACANIRQYVLDRTGQPLPDGMPGELGIAGPQVMRGYIGRADLNAEKLLPNSFFAHPDYPVIYRTGDIVRRLANGEIDYLDRMDRQVKIRGYRIELGEIELRLRESGWFNAVVVVDLDDPSGGKYLCCYYTADKKVDIDAVKATLAATMPPHMIPAAFMQLEAIPLNQNGKVHKAALPKPDVSASASEYAPPANDTESRLCDIWHAILGTSRPIGVLDNFYELGGNSIKAVTLQVRIRKEMDADLPMSIIMQNPTVRDLARLIVGGEVDRSSLPPIAKAEEREYYPLTPQQQQMFILWQTLDDKTAYNIPATYRLDGPLNVATLTAAMDSLVARHASLRTGFREAGGEVVQFVLPMEKARCKKMFKSASENEANDIIRDWIAPFNLARPPLVRFGLVQTGPESHILLVDSHHIVSDGLSLPTLMGDLMALYNGESPAAPTLDYTDYAVWFVENMCGAPLAEQESFWENQFADGVPRLELPLDFPRPALQSTAGEAISQPLSPQLFAGVKQLAHAHNTTPFTVLLGAWSTALARSAGTREVVVGVPHSGRTLPETATMPGMFVNTLPMLIRPEGSLSFAALMENIAALELAVQDKQNLSLSTLIDALNLPRDLSHNPIYDVSFNYLQADPGINSGSLALSSYNMGVDSLHFDLTLTVVASDESIRLNLLYATSLFKETSAQRFLDRVFAILETVVRDDSCLLHQIDLLGADERHRLLVDFNNNCFTASGLTLCDLVDAHGRERPQSPAVHDMRGTYTYGELSSRSSALARHIHDRVGAQTYVAVMLPRVRDIYVVELAVMKAGCAFLPIDPEYPDSRVEAMLRDSGARMILVDPSLAGRAAGFGLPVVDVTDAGILADNAVFGNLATPHGIAYLIYTSGSTGTPKGVMVRHEGLANIMEYFAAAFDVDRHASAAAYANFSFDVSIIDSWPFLVAGGSVHVIPETLRLDLDGLSKFLRENRITDLHLPTQFGEQLVADFESPFMKRVLIGGEKMRRIFDKSFAVYNSYGPTETSIDVNFKLVDRHYDNIPIGRPTGNVFEYVLDEFGSLVPIGVPGELCISGVQVAAGYLGRPTLTAEKFVANPYAVDDHTAIMYRTGDLVRWNADGEIEHLGRSDRQVKINGYRIELGEIELVISSLPGIGACTVVDLPDSSGGRYLCAYYTGEDEGLDAPDHAEVRRHLATALPKYMVPQAFVTLPSLPVTPSGKVDRRRLPDPVRHEATRTATPPSSEAEKKIHAVWQTVLGHSDFGIDDPFFDVGGNSLKAIRMVAQLKNIFDIDINRVYQYPTIRELAANSGEARFDLRTALQTAKRQSDGKKTLPEDLIPTQVREAYATYETAAATIPLDDSITCDSVLLCGATGYLGAFLLRALLEQTSARIHTLVRGAGPDAARERLAHKMRHYFGAGYTLPPERVVVWRGDLSLEHFGLTDSEYATLAEEVNLVLNSAANVRHYGRYEEFYQSNVQTVLNLVEFAKTGSSKRLCHVSTMSVANGLVEGKAAVLYGEADVDIGQVTDNVYIRSKLAAEVELMNAAAQGLDAQIFRVGNITPDSRHGVMQENIEENGFFSTVRSLVNLGIMSRSLSRREFSPVDKIAEAILLLSGKKALGSQIFHIHNPDLVDMGALFADDKMNTRVEVLDDSVFLDRLANYIDLETPRDLIESILLHTGQLDTGQETSQFVVRSGRTRSILDRLGFSWGEVSPAIVTPMIHKALEERARFLSGTKLFAGLAPEAVTSLAGLARMAVYEPDVVIEDGTVYETGILQKGVMEKSILSQHGWQGSVGVFGAGETFALSTLNGVDENSIYTPMFGEAQVLWFDREGLAKILGANPNASLVMLADIAKSLELFQRAWVNAE